MLIETFVFSNLIDVSFSDIIHPLMNLAELTEQMHKFVRSKGWYEPDSARPQTLRNLAISLNVEAAELLEHFQWGESSKNQSGLAEELADVALYLLQIASIAGIDLEKAILMKLERNYGREWDKKTDGGEISSSA